MAQVWWRTEQLSTQHECITLHEYKDKISLAAAGLTREGDEVGHVSGGARDEVIGQRARLPHPAIWSERVQWLCMVSCVEREVSRSSLSGRACHTLQCTVGGCLVDTLLRCVALQAK